MREIKFRFYHTKLRRMSKSSHGLGVIWEHLVDEWGIFVWKDIVTEQFTGLHDAKGREIYEGDRVRLHAANDTLSPYFGWGELTEGDEVVVEWVYAGGWFPFVATDDEPYPLAHNCEVIGNIHEGEA